MKNVVKTSKWLRWTAAGAFGLMLTLNVMVGLDFEKGDVFPSVTLRSLSTEVFAGGECVQGSVNDATCRAPGVVPRCGFRASSSQAGDCNYALSI